jgi:hypothetical protein
MFSLLLPRRRSSSVSTSFRPNLESLEQRDVPSTLTLNVAYSTGTNVILSGTLTGAANPANHTINLSGEVGGQAITDANGRYQITLQAMGLGDVSAADADGTSNTATATVADTSPNITNFNASEGPYGIWTFSGHVDYRSTDLTIYFAGQPISLRGMSTDVDANGNFSVTVQLNHTQSDNGWEYVYAVDAWGNYSNFMQEYIQQTGV